MTEPKYYMRNNTEEKNCVQLITHTRSCFILLIFIYSFLYSFRLGRSLSHYCCYFFIFFIIFLFVPFHLNINYAINWMLKVIFMMEFYDNEVEVFFSFFFWELMMEIAVKSSKWRFKVNVFFPKSFFTKNFFFLYYISTERNAKLREKRWKNFFILIWIWMRNFRLIKT